MRVGVDARSLAGLRGVAHYTSGLLNALVGAHPDDDWRLLVPGRRPLLLAPPPGARLVRSRLPGRVLHGSAALLGRPRADRLLGGDLDVALLPAPAPLALSPRVPRVVVFHDLSFAERPHDFTRYERLWHGLARPRRLAREATRIVVDDDSTRAALAALYGIDPGTVTVIPAGVDAPAPAPLEEVRSQLGIPGRYLLFVGALEPRKAPDLLAAAYGDARRRGLDAALVLVGEGRVHPHGEGIVHRHDLTRAQLDALYGGALALVLPSLLEGFGLPPLEALAAGTPPVVSDLPVYRRTLGDGALRFPPGDRAALADALLRICADAPLRERIVAAGRPHLARLTWERAAAAMHAVLEEACG